jgi:sialate O-acetylesterase
MNTANQPAHRFTFVLWASTLVLISLGARVSLADTLKFASPFTDHMVIQRGKPVQVWGSATRSSNVTVKLADDQASTTTGDDGIWHATLKPLTAGGPFTLTASAGSDSATVSDVLIGDVWLCSGQSNMQFSLKECDGADAVASVPHPNLRLGKVGQAWTATPQTTSKIRWAAASPGEAKDFSAVAYTFAHELESDPAMANVPIGILEDCLGGTVVESWLPKQSLASFDPKELQSSMFGIGPTLLYNAMIAPLGQTQYTGVIWYQGEGNAGEPVRYAKLLPLLFQTWREQFHDPNLPFLIVQLPDYAPDWGGVYWQWIRESEANAVAATPNTTLAVTINTNDGWNLHPQGKYEIGRRLALLARQQVYKEKIVGSGPKFKSVKVDGSTLVVSFDTDGDGLTSGTSPVDGFMIAAEDGVYHLADGLIDGDTVVLHSADVSAPATVRYAWAGVPRSTLTNKSGLPAAPFRTDSLPISKGQGEPQRQPTGYTFKAADYQIDISGDAKVTSLVTHYQQFLSNASGNWGGTSIENRGLQQAKLVGPQTIMYSNNETSFTVDLKPTGMTWTIKNTHPKDAVKFHIALASSVEVSGEGSTDLALTRKGVTMQVSGIDRVIQYHDVSADDGKVLEVDIPKGATKVMNIVIR